MIAALSFCSFNISLNAFGKLKEVECHFEHYTYLLSNLILHRSRYLLALVSRLSKEETGHKLQGEIKSAKICQNSP